MAMKHVPRSLFFGFLLLAACPALQAAGDQVQVIPASALDQWWVALPAHPNSWDIDWEQGADGFVAVAFEMQGDGSVCNERVWHSALNYPQSGNALEQAILRKVHQWQFTPAPANKGRASVHTCQVFTFTMTRVQDSMALDIEPRPTASDMRREEQQTSVYKSKCEVAMQDFPRQVQAMIGANLKARGGQR